MDQGVGVDSRKTKGICNGMHVGASWIAHHVLRFQTSSREMQQEET